eukprot:TRINITY_DN2680_c0_g2_i1.p1 TRINITY_DN2680_c0_g2~~TRINITY_DN2680_c0_g2_i1.p1  ORF type:complete len:906 (-),score=151.36 TRINITY_DN2680_c0_g2_i1:751-3468(-)
MIDHYYAQGYVHTKSVTHKKWTLHFAVICDGMIGLYQDESDLDSQEKCHPVELVPLLNTEYGDTKKKEGHKFVLSLVKPSDKKWKFDMSFADENECNTWFNVIKRNWDLLVPTIFGKTLEKACVINHTSIPNIVTDLIDIIQERYLQIEGIFRIPGHQGKTNAAKDLYNDGITPDIQNMECHTLCGLLKLYLRELSDPLIPMSHYQAFISAGSQDHDHIEDAVRSAIQSLPDYHLMTLTYLMRFLGSVAEFNEVNLMNPENIATCFGPTIIRMSENSSFNAGSLSDMSVANSVTRYMVANHAALFDYSILDSSLHFRTERKVMFNMTRAERALIEPILISATPNLILNTSTLRELFCTKRVNLKSKSGVLESRIFVCGSSRCYLFLAGARLESNFHYLDVRSIESTGKSYVTIVLGDNRATEYQICPVTAETNDIDDIIHWIYSSLSASSFTTLFPLAIQPEERAKLIFGSTDDEIPLSSCNGLLNTYISICDFMGLSVNSDLIWDIEQLYHPKMVKVLDLSEIMQPEKYPQDVIPLLQSMRYTSWFNKVIVDGTELTAEIYTTIAELMKNDRSIKELILRSSSMTKITVESIGTSILNNPVCGLTYLDLSGNDIEDRGCNIVAQCISDRLFGLETLKVSRVNSGKKGTQAIVGALINLSDRGINNITCLDVSHNKFEKETSRLLGEFLTKNASLTELDISYTSVNLECLGTTLGINHSVQKIDVSGNKFVPKHKTSFIQIFCSLASITDINLSTCSISGQVIADIFSPQSAIRKLNISHNEMSDDSVKVLFDRLANNPGIMSLTELNMNSCLTRKSKQRGDAMRAIISLVNRECLKRIHFTGSKKAPLKSDILPFVYNLINSRSVKYLDISGHLAGDQLANCLSKILPSRLLLISFPLKVPSGN